MEAVKRKSPIGPVQGSGESAADKGGLIGSGGGLEESGAHKKALDGIMNGEPYKSHFEFVGRMSDKERAAAKKVK